ncbi:MAG TPA: hypothetical protein VMU16_04720 [Candidatus Binataceae bacterium]|nr:hypothetical protein [Candidatus Binataceae bacterium]
MNLAKSLTVQLLATVAFMGQFPMRSAAADIRAIKPGDIVARASGVGSMRGVLLRDGTICITDHKSTGRCEPLGKIPDDIVAKFKPYQTTSPDRSTYYRATFYGIFDLAGDGTLEAFIDYWPDGSDADCPAWSDWYDEEQPRGKDDLCDEVTLLVLRRSGRSFNVSMKLHAPTQGYFPGAWFLSELPVRKAIFSTRCGGSSGLCLFYLDFKRGALDEITDDCALVDYPTFMDIDNDGNSEIYLNERGRDRIARRGASILRWAGDKYRIWWPNWQSLPYVMSARLLKAKADNLTEIVAILDPKRESAERELGVWKLTGGDWSLVDKTRLPDVEDPNRDIAFPDFSKLNGDAADKRIALTYGNDAHLVCHFRDNEVTCPAHLSRAK